MRRIALATIMLMAAGPLSAAAESSLVSDVLKKTSELMKERKYKEAQQLVTDSLNTEKDSFKLWLAMGNVLEADSQYAEALKAFYKARDLKDSVEGLKERIQRLENLLKNTLPAAAPVKATEAEETLARAKYFVESGSTKKGLVEFVKAVHLNRGLIGQEQKLIDLGLNFFSNQQNLFTTEEKNCYLGFYSFFAGNYEDASRELNAYIKQYPEGSEVEKARQKLDEIALLEEQLRAITQQKKPPVKQIKTKPVTSETVKPAEQPQPANPENAGQQATSPAPESEPYVAPVVVDEFAGLDPAQLYTEAMSIAEKRPLKAIGLLGKAIKSGDALPEYYMGLANLYASRKGFEKEAVSSYRDILQKFPGTVLASEAKRKILEMNPSPEQRAREVGEHYNK